MNTRYLFRAVSIMLLLSIFLLPKGTIHAGSASFGNGSLIWNTFLGSSADDFGTRIAIDATGNTYIVGTSFASWGKPVNPHAGSSDAFVVKLNNNGELVWNTFLGGGNNDDSFGVALDGSRNIYVLGISRTSWGSPKSPFQGGYYDVFVAKLNNNGALLWNTFLGGIGDDQAYGISAEAGGNMYVTGASTSNWGTPLSRFAGMTDAFVAKLDAQGTRLWNTFLGGPGQDGGFDIIRDLSGNLFITGFSRASWGTPRHPYAGGNGDAFIAKLSGNGTRIWNSFLGGSAMDDGMGIDLDAGGRPHITGGSGSTWGEPLNPFAGDRDAYVAALDGEGYLIWNTFLGGGSSDSGYAIEVNGAGDIYVSGASDTAWGTPLRPFAGRGDGFIAGLDASGALHWSTFLGGNRSDEAGDIVLDQKGNAYIAGYSGSGWGTPRLAARGLLDVFVAKWGTARRFFSDGALDGMTLESAETSNQGGTMNASAATFTLGDDAADRQYRAVLSFNTSALPDTAVITKATLKVKQQGIVGTNPFTTHVGLNVDIRKPYFGPTGGLALSDFQAAASRLAVATFNKTPTTGAWYSAALGSTAYPYINRTGTTQFRLRFARDDNDDISADYVKFYSGNTLTASYRPMLVVEYYVP